MRFTKCSIGISAFDTIKGFLPTLLPTANTKQEPLFFYLHYVPKQSKFFRNQPQDCWDQFQLRTSFQILVSNLIACLFFRYKTQSMSAFQENGIASLQMLQLYLIVGRYLSVSLSCPCMLCSICQECKALTTCVIYYCITDYSKTEA